MQEKETLQEQIEIARKRLDEAYALVMILKDATNCREVTAKDRAVFRPQ